MALYVVLPIGIIQVPFSLFVGTFLPARNPYLGQVARAFCAFGTITESRRQAYPGHAAYTRSSMAQPLELQVAVQPRFVAKEVCTALTTSPRTHFSIPQSEVISTLAVLSLLI